MLGRASVTSFVGRRDQLAEVKTRLRESRLVTLTGPGGVGKTRLAVELAKLTCRSFGDGVRFVGLDILESSDRVASQVADVLQVPDQSNRRTLDRVINYVRDKEFLLILDNCEHVLQSVAELVDALLVVAPKCRVLATSREPLGLIGEQVCAVPPLTAPPEDPAEGAPGAADGEEFEAVSLFVDRARHTVPGFEVTPDNREAIGQIAARLDGIPLAIELAVTRLRTLSPAELLKRLDKRFQLLNRGDRAMLPRQQTLEALIGWSYELCEPAEQVLWRRLSVFPGSFDLAAAEAVCGDDDLDSADIFDLLDQLVAKSIVVTDRSGDCVRYRMLMTIREYGGHLLTDEEEFLRLRRRHRDLYLRRAVERAEGWCGPEQARALAHTRSERANLMVAIDWSLSTPGEHDAAALLATNLRYYWVSCSFLSNGRDTLERILREGDLSPRHRGDASWVIGWVCLIQGDHGAAAEHLRTAERIAGELGDAVMEAHHKHWKGLHELFTGDLAAAIALYGEAVDAHRRDGRTADQLLAMFQLVMAMAFNGQPGEGLEIAEEAEDMAKRHGERWNLSFIHWISGICHWWLGDHAAAERAVTEALAIQRDFHDGLCIAHSIEVLSWVAVSTGNHERGWELASAANSVWRAMGTSLGAFGPHIAETSRRSAEACRDELGLGPGEGADPVNHLGIAEAVEVGLGASALSATEAPSPENPLTSREMEVAELVAEGLTNREIAERFVLSKRTVDGHLERIFTKLDFSSRAQLAGWVENQRNRAAAAEAS